MYGFWVILVAYNLKKNLLYYFSISLCFALIWLSQKNKAEKLPVSTHVHRSKVRRRLLGNPLYYEKNLLKDRCILGNQNANSEIITTHCSCLKRKVCMQFNCIPCPWSSKLYNHPIPKTKQQHTRVIWLSMIHDPMHHSAHLLGCAENKQFFAQMYRLHYGKKICKGSSNYS